MRQNYPQLEQLLRSSRRRHIVNVVFSQVALACAAGLAGMLVLLLAGSDVLHPGWILALFAATLAILLLRLRGRIPGEYRVARQVDESLDSPDLFSSAWYFLRNPDRRSPPALVAALGSKADEAAQGVAAAGVVPMRFPRSGYYAGAAFAAVFALFMIRYGVTGSLDLRPPLGGDLWQVARANLDRALELPPARGADSPAGDQQEPGTGDEKGQEQEKVREEQITQEVPVQSEAYTAGDEDQALSKGDLDVPGDPLEGMPGSEPAEPGGEEAGSSDSSGQSGGESGQDPQNGEQGKADSDSGNDPLLEKLQDAMQNLLSRLKMPNKQGSSRDSKGQSAETQASAKKQMDPQAPQAGGKSSDGQGQSGQQAEGENRVDGAGQEQKAEGGRASDQAGDDAPGSSRTGMGQQDGKKEIKEAQQLEAMGKLAEVLGKRSETISGEMTAEVASGPQRLRTPYSEQKAGHSAAGAEIHRNQVPLALQPYVQGYFEQVHKEAAAADARRKAQAQENAQQ